MGKLNQGSVSGELCLKDFYTNKVIEAINRLRLPLEDFDGEGMEESIATTLDNSLGAPATTLADDQIMSPPDDWTGKPFEPEKLGGE